MIRQRIITPILRSKLWTIEERLRLCKVYSHPFDLNNKDYDREEFCKAFSKVNLHDCCFICKTKSKLLFLEESRFKIVETTNVILAYREYINIELFDFLSELLNSEYIRNGVDAYPDIEGAGRFEYNGNQPQIGECIYDLYEKIKTINI